MSRTAFFKKAVNQLRAAIGHVPDFPSRLIACLIVVRRHLASWIGFEWTSPTSDLLFRRLVADQAELLELQAQDPQARRLPDGQQYRQAWPARSAKLET
jgi:hypothetical protein